MMVGTKEALYTKPYVQWRERSAGLRLDCLISTGEKVISLINCKRRNEEIKNG